MTRWILGDNSRYSGWSGKNKEIEDQRFLVYNKEKAVNGIMLTETGGAKQWKKAYGASL